MCVGWEQSADCGAMTENGRSLVGLSASFRRRDEVTKIRRGWIWNFNI